MFFYKSFRTWYRTGSGSLRHFVFKKQKKLTLSYLESVTLSWTERGIAFRGAIRYSTWKEAMKFEQIGHRSFDY